MSTSGWVCCSDRLPEIKGLYFIRSAGAGPSDDPIALSWYVGGEWGFVAEPWRQKGQAITHWMEVPGRSYDPSLAVEGASL